MVSSVPSQRNLFTYREQPGARMSMDGHLRQAVVRLSSKYILVGKEGENEINYDTECRRENRVPRATSGGT